MILRFLFDDAAWETPAARHAMESVAMLLETPWRAARARSEDAGGEGPIVFVGRPDAAPSDTAAVVAVSGWPEWKPESLDLATFDGEPLPCPGGANAGDASGVTFPAEWLRAVGFMLQRDEERLDPRRDQWECYSGFTTRFAALGLLDRPLINRYAAQLERRVAAWCGGNGVTLRRLPRWKSGKRFAVALTHDVDDVTLFSLAQAWRLVRRARTPTSYAARGGVAMAVRTLRRGSGADPYWNFDRWAAEESRRGFSSTFYVLPPSPSRVHEYDGLYRMNDPVSFEGRRITVARLLRLLSERGFEIGLHGSYLSHTSAEELTRQRAQVQAAAQTSVRGIRQHFLRFDVRATWAAQERAGFDHDSTLGYNEAIGFRAGIAAPYHAWDGGRGTALPLVELPLTVMDGTLFRTLALDARRAAARTIEHLERVEEAGGLAVLLWHPNAGDEEHFPGWWESYLLTLDWLAGRDAWVTSAGEIATWWQEREAEVRRTVERPSSAAP